MSKRRVGAAPAGTSRSLVWVDTLARWWREISAAPLVLEARQARTLWHAIVAESSEAAALIDTRAVADWACAAHALLAQHAIHPDHLARAEPSAELAALRRWSRTYRETLEARGWLDAESVLGRVAADGVAGAARTVQLLDCVELGPLEQRCLERLGNDGWRFEHVAVPLHAGPARRLAGSGIAEELERAVEWCLERLRADASALIALVVPRHYAPAETLERLLTAAPAVTVAVGQPAARSPAVAAALNALTLFSPAGGILELSHWLRSPFFHAPDSVDAADAARIESDLRETLIAQLPFTIAFREAGLARQIERHAPTLAARLARAGDRLARTEQPRSPARWTELWRAGLRDLGWLAGQDPALMQAARTLDLAFSELAKLTAVSPRMSLVQALAECRRILDAPLLLPRMPLAGIHVLEHIDDVGPGYAGVWAVGFTDGAWPERRMPNPLLPRRVQARHGMAWSSPSDTLARARRSITRVCRVAPEVVLSWPEHDLETTCLPSPLILGLDQAVRVPQVRVAPAASSELEVCVDAAPPLVGRRIPGGAGTLSQQARCPLRAFVERRLGAKPLRPWVRGLSPRQRGILIHRAAAALLAPGTTRTGLADFGTEALALRIETAAERALDPAFGALRSRFGLIRALERERLARLLGALVVAELHRGDFEIVACETDVLITLRDHEIRARLDRLDQLGGGGTAIIDYKTGLVNASPDWFVPPLGDPQVPLYAVHVGPDLAAAVLCSLGPDGARYRGAWRDRDAFPGTAVPLPPGLDWPTLHAHWSGLLGDLVAAFAGGDVRIRIEGMQELEGLLAPLTRVYEVRALPPIEDAGQ